jgi:dTDP-4-dehydrorhamnose reductase
VKVLVTGAGGQLGGELVRVCTEAGDDVVGAGHADLDIGDRDAVLGTVLSLRPDVVVNCGAWTAVDACESDPERAFRDNGMAGRWMAEACRRSGAHLVHVSTDYVFDGTSATPYLEDAATGPVNAYGRTKLAGERAALEHGQYVVRTAWLYGAAGTDFVRTMIRLAGERPFVDVVDDQRGQPTWAADLADFLVRLAQSDLPPGVYHGTCSGETTWYGLAREIFTLLGADPGRVRPVTGAGSPRPARRPANSVLACTRAEPLRHWRAALHAAWPVIAANAGPQCNVA